MLAASRKRATLVISNVKKNGLRWDIWQSGLTVSTLRSASSSLRWHVTLVTRHLEAILLAPSIDLACIVQLGLATLLSWKLCPHASEPVMDVPVYCACNNAHCPLCGCFTPNRFCKNESATAKAWILEVGVTDPWPVQVSMLSHRVSSVVPTTSNPTCLYTYLGTNQRVLLQATTNTSISNTPNPTGPVPTNDSSASSPFTLEITLGILTLVLGLAAVTVAIAQFHQGRAAKAAKRLRETHRQSGQPDTELPDYLSHGFDNDPVDPG